MNNDLSRSNHHRCGAAIRAALGSLEEPEMTMHPMATIHGYVCEMEPNSDRAGWQCWVSKGRHTNSLACLEGEGQFDDGPLISERALVTIRQWANKHGYDE